MSSARTAVLEKYPQLFPHDPADERGLFFLRSLGWQVLAQVFAVHRTHDPQGYEIRYPSPIDKFPPVAKCPRWFGKSCGWLVPANGTYRRRFTEFDGMDRICSLLTKAGRIYNVDTHKPPYIWEVVVFPSHTHTPMHGKIENA